MQMNQFPMLTIVGEGPGWIHFYICWAVRVGFLDINDERAFIGIAKGPTPVHNFVRVRLSVHGLKFPFPMPLITTMLIMSHDNRNTSLPRSRGFHDHPAAWILDGVKSTTLLFGYLRQLPLLMRFVLIPPLDNLGPIIRYPTIDRQHFPTQFTDNLVSALR
jgi:hypothetical protein